MPFCTKHFKLEIILHLYYTNIILYKIRKLNNVEFLLYCLYKCAMHGHTRGQHCCHCDRLFSLRNLLIFLNINIDIVTKSPIF